MCLAPEAICRKCNKKGHYQSNDLIDCKSTAAFTFSPLPATTSQNGVLTGLKKSSISVQINRKRATALIDSRSSVSFILPFFVQVCSYVVCSGTETISMAIKTLTVRVQEHS